MMNRKILILTMSCNLPYFQALLGAVKDTWAKPLMHNKIKNVTWFAYTACDEKHPVPCVDFEDHMIYVDCDDGLLHTYEKTQKAYNMIKDVVDFNYVIRTNTSVFINVEKLIERVNTIGYNDIMARAVKFFITHSDGTQDFMSYTFIGFLMTMNRDIFDVAMSANNEYITDKFGEVVYTHDDIIMSKRIFDVLHTVHNVGFNDEDICPAYKVFQKDDVPDVAQELPKKDFFFEPSFINDFAVARLRTLYRHDDGDSTLRSTKGHEIEHMYELYNALK